MLVAPVRYFDVERRRPGLPLDVAALVTKRDAEHTVVQLINLNPVRPRELIIQAGTLAENRFTDVNYGELAAAISYPGVVGDYAPPTVNSTMKRITVQDAYLHVRLRPSTKIDFQLGMDYVISRPGYARGPFR